MANIQDFIQSAAANFGVGEDVVGTATGGLLGGLAGGGGLGALASLAQAKEPPPMMKY